MGPVGHMRHIVLFFCGVGGHPYLLVELMGIAPMSKIEFKKYSTSLVCLFRQLADTKLRIEKQTKIFETRPEECFAKIIQEIIFCYLNV